MVAAARFPMVYFYQNLKEKNRRNKDAADPRRTVFEPIY